MYKGSCIHFYLHFYWYIMKIYLYFVVRFYKNIFNSHILNILLMLTLLQYLDNIYIYFT